MQKQPLILIVEDEADIRETTRFQLEDAGYSIIEAVDGKEAIAMASLHKPDIILMDINVPFMDGINACRLIKKSLVPVYKRNIPIVMVTALSSDAALSAASNAGADSYVTKPFAIEHLIRTIKHVLKSNS
jgi:CheY-like chemotaxis protein